MAASSGSTGFGGLDNNTVTGNSEKGGPAVAAVAALAWRTPWEGGPPRKRLKTDTVPKTPEKRPGIGLPF